MKEFEEKKQFDENNRELKEKLERKEYFMQSKEKKWNEIERILQEYIEDDDELREKFYELRINVEPKKQLSNVVDENSSLKQ